MSRPSSSSTVTRGPIGYAMQRVRLARASARRRDQVSPTRMAHDFLHSAVIACGTPSASYPMATGVDAVFANRT